MSQSFPTNITANFTFSATFTFPYQLRLNDFTLAFRGPATVDIAGVVSNNAVTFTDILTTAGNYSFTVYCIDINGVKTLLAKGMTEVSRDPTSISVDEDLRTHPERVLAAIEAVIEDRATKDQQSYTINGRSLTKTPISELLLLRDKYKDEVKNQHKKLPRAVLYHFGSR